MATSAATSSTRHATSFATLIGAAVALVGVACSGAAAGSEEGVAMPEARLGSSMEFESEPVAISDPNRVQVLGRVEAIVPGAAPAATPAKVPGATVCLITERRDDVHHHG